MASSVPFALLASSQLLGVAAWTALAGAAAFPGARTRLSPLVALGALLSAAADVVTGIDLGTASSSSTAYLRAIGAVVVAAGLLAGAPGVRPRDEPPRASGPVDALDIGTRARAALRRGSAAAPPLPAVAPFFLATGPGTVAGAALVVAAALAAASGRGERRARGSGMLAGGLLLAGAAAFAGAYGSGEGGGDTVLVLRGLGAVVMIAWAGRLATGSLLAKIVTSILGGLVLASVVVAAVVGSVVTNRLGDQQATQVRQVAQGQFSAFTRLQGSNQVFAELFGQALPGQLAGFASLVGSLNNNQKIVMAQVSLVKGKPKLTTYLNEDHVIDNAGLDSLVGAQAVTDTLAQGGATDGGALVLEGSKPIVLLANVTSEQSGTKKPTYTRIYGLAVTQALLQNNGVTPGFDTTIVDLETGQVAASSLSDKAAAAIAADVRVQRQLKSPPPENSALDDISTGKEPTLGFYSLPLGNSAQPAALIVVSADSSQIIGTQRTLLQVLFISLLGAAVIVAVLALLVGRRIVTPVLQLTDAAERVRGGDLTATTGTSGHDEVGVLARTFDAMTHSLARADTELRETMQQETAVRTRLEAVLEAIGDGLLVADASGLVETVNPAAALLVGDDVLGLPLAEVVRGVPVDQRFADGTLEAADGRRVPVVAAAEELADGSGLVLVLRDLTREREVERMKTEFLSNVSHELRTPLTPIRGFAKILAGRQLPPEKVAEYAGTIEKSSQRLSRVVDLLVEVAALDAGRVTPEPERVRLRGFIDERLDVWRTKVPERAADLVGTVGRGIPDALVDARWLAKAVDELLDNALKFSPAGTPVTLAARAHKTRARVRLEVHDKGAGIPEEARAALFLDFEQVDGSATRARDGLGLGLPFVRRVADVVGLRLGLTSAVGKGSVFTLEVLAAPDETPRNGQSTTRRSRSAQLSTTP